MNRRAERRRVESGRWSSLGRGLAALLVFLAAANCSTGPEERPDEEPKSQRPIEPDGEVERQTFEEARRAIEAGDWQEAKEAFRLVQARESSGEVAQLAELYVGRAELGELESMSSESEPGDGRRRAIQMFSSLADDDSVDERVRRAAAAYASYIDFAEGKPGRAVRRLEEYPDGRLGSAVLDGDRMELWPVLVEGLIEAERPLTAVRAAAAMAREVDRRRASDGDKKGDVVAAPARSEEGRADGDDSEAEVREGTDGESDAESEGDEIPAEQAEALADFARSRGFSAAAQLGEAELEEHLEADSGFVRAVVGWTYLNRALQVGELTSTRREELDRRYAEVSADLNAIGSPNRASELSIKLATVGGGKRLVIGALLPLDGDNESVGQRALSGMLLAIRAFRHAGPSRVTLVFENSNDDPAEVLGRLDDLGAAAVVGPMEPTRGDAFAVEARELELPMVALTARQPKDGGEDSRRAKTSGDGESNGETDRESRPADADGGQRKREGASESSETDGESEEASPFVLRNFMDPLTEARAVANLAFHEFGDRRAVVVRPNIGYGEETARAFEREFRALGGQIAETITYERGGSDYSSTADRLAATNADVVFIPDSASKIAELTAFFADRDIWGTPPSKQAKRGGGRRYVHYLGTSLWHGQILHRQAASYVEGAVIPAWFAPVFDDNATRQFANRFKAVFGREAGNIEAFAYDNVRWVRRLMVEQGVQTSRSLQASLLGASPYRGATGRGQFQPDGTLRRTVRFVRVAEEGFEPLETRVELTPEEGEESADEEADPPADPPAEGSGGPGERPSR